MQTTIPFIADHLGGSIIYEECKGNFTLARSLAEECLSSARQQNDTHVISDALLARGIVHLLQGECSAALACFEETLHLASLTPARKLMAFAYAKLATYLRFVAFPTGSGGSTIEIRARWDLAAYAQEQEQQWQELVRYVDDPSILLETHLIAEMLCNLFPARYCLDGLYIVATQEKIEQLLGGALQGPLAFRQQVEASGIQPEQLAYTDFATADLYRRVRNNKKVGQFLSQAYDAYAKNSDSAGMALCYMALGDLLLAPNSTPLVWNHFIREGSESNQLFWFYEKAEFDRSRVDVPGAQRVYAEAERLFTGAGAQRGLAALHLRYDYMAVLSGDYTGALEHVTQAQRTFEAVGDTLGVWVARAHSALCMVGTGHIPEPIATAEAIGKWGRVEGSLSFSLGLGLLFAREGRRWLMQDGAYERALACFRLAEALFRQLGVPMHVAQVLADQGAVYQSLGEHTAASDMYEQALEFFIDETKRQRGLATLAWQLAVSLGGSIYQIALSRRDADGMERSAARWRSLAGQPPPPDGSDLFGPGSPDLLDEYVQTMLEQLPILAPLYHAVAAQNNCAQQTADGLFNQALAAARQLGPEQAGILEGVVLGEWHRYPEAIAVYQRFLEQRGEKALPLRDTVATILQSFGRAGRDLRDLNQEQIHELAATFFVRCKAYAEAKAHLDRVEQARGPEWWKRNDRPWEALSNYGAVYAGLGQLQQALVYYDRAIAELEARRGLLRRDELKIALANERETQYLYFLAERVALYLKDEAERAHDDAHTQTYAVRAFDYAERGKARSLLDLIAGSSTFASSLYAPESQAMGAWRQANAQLATHRGLLSYERAQPQPDPERIASLDHLIEADEQSLRNIETSLATANPDFYKIINPQAGVMNIDEVRARLAPGTALLQYAFLGEDLLACAITSQGIVQTHRATINTRTLACQIRAFHGLCEGRGRLDETGLYLAETLLHPFAEIIRTNQRLIVVPYGTAYLLPFHALPWEGQPLVATHTISYLPSASTLEFLHSSETSTFSERLLAVGDPAHMSFRRPLEKQAIPLPSLPAAATEAAFVAGLFPQGKKLLGEQATKPAVLAELANYQILHFATHGYLSEEVPFLSSILLAEGEMLSLYELMGLQLHANLVVLSACNTAQGETTNGDDVLGLTRGLLGAGARAAVVSLWPVNDVSTSLLMGEFYRHLHAGETPAVALQAAQNYLRNLSPDAIKAELEGLRARLEQAEADATALQPEKETQNMLDAGPRHVKPEVNGTSVANDYSHPCYWAPFILVGGSIDHVERRKEVEDER